MITIGYVQPDDEESFNGLYDDYVLLPAGEYKTFESVNEAREFITQESIKEKPQWPFNSCTIYIFENEKVLNTIRPKKH